MGATRRPRATTAAAAAAPAPSSAAASNSGLEEALLARIASRSKVCGLGDQVRAYLEADGKENEGHARAKQLIPFVSRLLKQCGQELGAGPSEGEKAFNDEIFGVMGAALDCLERLRSWLAGSPIDVEIQRYGLVRRLMAWRIYDKAADECRKVMLSLNAYISSAGCSKIPSKSQKSKRVVEVPTELVLSPGKIKDMPSGLPALVVGLTGDFILCTVESGVRDEEVLRRIAISHLQVDPWLRTMDPSGAEKHQEVFFKTLYRASSVLVSDQNVAEVDVLMSFCKITLEWCVRAGQTDQYLKVARRLCSCSTSSLFQSDLCAAVLSDLANVSQLQGLRRSYELLEFVECYSKVCQSSGCSFSKHFFHFVEKAKADVGHPVTVLCVLYALSLRLSNESAKDCPMDEKLIQSAIEAVRWSFGLTACGTWVWTTEARVGAFKALDYARKNFVNYAQVKWDHFLSSSSQLQYLPADSWALQLLHLFCEAVHAASRNPDQQDLLTRGFRGAPTAAIAALRLSLILGIELEKSVKVTRDIMSSTAVQSDELRWLISMTYNMGVQVYNKKHYDLACEPLELASDAAWCRVSAIAAEGPKSIFDAVLEAYGKTTAFFDSLKRNGSHGKAKTVLLRALRCWLAIHNRHGDIEPPEPLLRLWNKLSLGQPGTVCCLYGALCGLGERLPAVSLGLLLEEHLALLENVLQQRPADVETRKEALVNILLEQVYHVEDFPIERSRLLLEKTRAVRRHGAENLQFAIELLSQALEILDAASNVICSDELLLRLQYHRAVAYLLRAHCTQEAAPASKEYIDDVTCAVRSWDSLLVAKHAIWKYNPRRFYSKESVIQLLISTADLLSLKGYHSVQLQVQGLAQEISAHDQVARQERLSIWANARISHVLCLVPYSEKFVSMLTGSAGRRVDTLDFWCKCARNCPDSLINARQNLLYADKFLFPDPLEEYANDLEIALKPQTMMPPNAVKSAREVIASAGQKFFVAEVFFQRGDVGAALKCATECLQLRSKLVNRIFQPSCKDGGATKKFEASGTLATCGWPSLYASSSDSSASQWHILGDYIESLMQVGVLHQTMGVADDAEKSFQEGLRLSQEQNLPFARVLFLLSLGEVHRKEHVWHVAEEEFYAARDILEDMDSRVVCSHCLVIAKANLQLRLGDLARRCPKNDPENTVGNPDRAIAHYDSAAKILRELSLFEEACATAEKPILLKCSTRGKKQAEPASKNLFHEFVHIKVENKSMSSWIASKWQTVTKRLMGKLLLGKGKCYHMLRVFNKAQKVYLQASSMLCISKCCLSPPHWNWCQSRPQNPFLLEEAAVLHHLSLLLLLQLRPCENRVACEDSSLIISWLYRAFSSSCSAPLLFRKISQLLAVVHAFLPFSISDFPIGRNVAELKEIAAYFHQASIGSRSRQQHLVMLQSKLDSLQDDGKVQCLEGMVQALRVLPENSDFPVASVRTLVDDLPSTTVCCISLLDEELSFLFQGELIDKDQHTAWLLISRFGDGDVAVLKFPIRIDSSSANKKNYDEENERRGRHKSILEGDALVRNVLAELAEILQESRQSTSSSLPISTQEEKSQWWKWRTQLDARLATFLRDVESCWFGPWKCLLLGEPLQGPVAEALRKKAKDICKLLKSKAFLGQTKLPKSPDEALVKVLLQAVCSLEISDIQICVSYILGLENTDESGPSAALIAKAADAFVAGYAAVMSPETATRSRGSRKATSPKPSIAIQTFEREAVQLVLDGRLQGFPWESLPVMRKHEAYRMPSLGSIRALSLFHKYSSSSTCDLSEGLARLRISAKSTSNSAKDRTKPSVNPFNTFYLLNPSGDLETTQAAFEEWFRRQKGWEGKAGQVPTVEEYVAGLQQHDLFIYLGHGSGDQYLPEKYIRKLDNCPASLLMGCSSGRFSARGDYEPVGVPLSYLMAGCPVAIANLWDVTDGDIDRFSRTVLHSWLDKKDTPATSSEEPKAKKPVKAAPRRGRSAKGTGQDAGIDSQAGTGTQDWEELRIGPSVEAGRDSCKLPYLIGASPVCFGVPTIIRRSRAALASSPSSSTT